mgnify:CR=1 FL=1
MAHRNPDLAWYTAISERKGLLPRCPFASVYRCPRFYQSLSLLGEAGSTKIDPEEDKKLLEQWSRSNLWPAAREQTTSILGPPGGSKNFLNFCPEVSFERFGLFASCFYGYTDEIDLNAAHSRLAKEDASHTDWRWAWEHVLPMHYLECPLYSLLQGGGPNLKPQRSIGFHPQ